MLRRNQEPPLEPSNSLSLASMNPRPHASEFINLVASEAHEISEKEKKKAIGPEHIVKAVEARL